MRVATIILLICCTAWAVGGLVVGGLVAPAVFAQAPPRGDELTRPLAGLLVGEVLLRWSLAALVLWAAALGCLLRLGVGLVGGRRWRLVAMVATAALVLLALRPINHALISEGRTLAADIRVDPGAQSDGRAARFRTLHGASMGLGAVEILVVLLTAGGAAVAVANASGPVRRP